MSLHDAPNTLPVRPASFRLLDIRKLAPHGVGLPGREIGFGRVESRSSLEAAQGNIETRPKSFKVSVVQNTARDNSLVSWTHRTL